MFRSKLPLVTGLPSPYIQNQSTSLTQKYFFYIIVKFFTPSLSYEGLSKTVYLCIFFLVTTIWRQEIYYMLPEVFVQQDLFFDSFN